MKRSLTMALIVITALYINAQGLNFLTGGYTPYHAAIKGTKPNVSASRDAATSGLKDYTAFFEISSTHYAYAASIWNILDSSALTYNNDSAFAFAVADTVFSYVSPSESWMLDSEFSVGPAGSRLPLNKMGQAYSGGTWNNVYQYNYGYDATGRQNSIIYQTWNGSTWTNVSMTTYGFIGSTNAIDSESTFLYNGTTWLTDSQYVYSYNSLGQDSVVFIQLGDGSTGWNPAFKFTYQYTPTTNIFTGIAISSYNSGNYTAYGTYSYNRNSNQASYLLQVNGVNTYEENFTYDYRNNITSFENDSFSNGTAIPLVQYTYNYDIHNDITFEQDAYWSNGAYQPTDQYYYYYQLRTISGVNEVSNTLNAGVFPNPSTGDVNIRFDAQANSSLLVSVYDATGRKMTEMKTAVIAGANNLPLQLNQLATGNYLITLTDASGSNSTLKFEKQ